MLLIGPLADACFDAHKPALPLFSSTGSAEKSRYFRLPLYRLSVIINHRIAGLGKCRSGHDE